MAFDAVFKRAALDFGGSFASDRGILSFGIAEDFGLVPVLIQNLGLNFAQTVSRLYEAPDTLGHSSVYLVGGRAQGAATIQRVLGPDSVLRAFYRHYGDLCNSDRSLVQFGIRPLCGDQVLANGMYLLRYVTLERVGALSQSTDLLLSENNQLQFGLLDYGGP